MKVLSLFDGISCARVALERANIPVELYLASEVDKYAIQVSQKNYPNIEQLGSVVDIYSYQNNFQTEKVNIACEIDLLIGGSPCQDLSIAKKNRKGLDGERSGLFWEYVRILKEVKPKWFILENVASMSKESKNIITQAMGVEPIMINASLVSAQNRKRLFWTNIPNVQQPEDRGILLKDILESGESDSRIYSPEGKSVSLSANGGGRGAKTGLYEVENSRVRKLTPVECERLQGLPDDYTEGISNTQRYKCLGNAFNVDVVAHILSCIPKK